MCDYDTDTCILVLSSWNHSEHIMDKQELANWQLMRACADGDLDGIQEALRCGAELKTRTSKYAMLPVKCWEGELVAAGDAMDSSCGLTPLMLASKEGRVEAVRLLVAAGASLHAEDWDGMQPLHFA